MQLSLLNIFPYTLVKWGFESSVLWFAHILDPWTGLVFQIVNFSREKARSPHWLIPELNSTVSYVTCFIQYTNLKNHGKVNVRVGFDLIWLMDYANRIFWLQNIIAGAFKPPCKISISLAHPTTRKQVRVRCNGRKLNYIITVFTFVCYCVCIWFYDDENYELIWVAKTDYMDQTTP